MNFMLLVPLASYPAVEICSDRSLAGISRWARVTLYSGRNSDLEPPADGRVGVDHRGHVVDQVDDHLGQVVRRRRLAGEEDRPRRHVEPRVLAQAVVEDQDVQDVQELPLVLVDPLDLDVEDASRGRPTPRSPTAASRRTGPWPRAWPRGTLGGRRGRRPGGRSPGAATRSVTQPSPIASVSRADRPGLARSSQRRGVTPLVLLLNRSGNSPARSFSTVVPQQPGVDRGDAVGAVRPDDRQVRHPDLLLRALLDQADPRNAGRRRRGTSRAPRRGTGG